MVNERLKDRVEVVKVCLTFIFLLCVSLAQIIEHDAQPFLKAIKREELFNR